MATQNLAAILESPKTEVVIKARPIPTPGPDELIIRNHAIASNPVDWKVQAYDFFIKDYPTILGSDVCGTVHAVGSSVTKFSVGDRVLSFAGTITNPSIDRGAWQTYTTSLESTTTKIPANMAFEEGAVLPLGMATSACALFVDLAIARPPALADGKEGILIWGGASSVGISAVQILKACGYKVFTTASPANHEYVKSLGAYEVFNYRDEDVVSKIVASAQDAGVALKLAFDTIVEGTTMKQSADILLASGGKGGKIALALGWPEEIPKPDGIETFNTFAARLGTDQAELGTWFFNEWLQNVLEKGEVVPAPEPEVIEGGIKNTQKVLNLHKHGVSNKKLVLKVD